MPRKSADRPAAPASETADAEALSFAGLSDLIGYQLRRAQGAVHRDFMATVADVKLTQKQTAVLWLVAHNAGIAQGALGTALGMDRATMMALVDRMEERGLIVRERSSVDARRRELHATPEGQRQLTELRKRIARHEARLQKLYTPAELRTMLRLLHRLQQLGD